MSGDEVQTDDESVSAQSLGDMVLGIHKGRILLAAFELDVFTALGQTARSVAEVAQELGTAERSTDRLMSALCALGLLSKKDGKYANTPITSRYLVKSSPDYLAQMMYSVRTWDNWSTLTEAVRQGRPVVPRPIDDRRDQQLRDFFTAMHARSTSQAAHVVRLLDLGGVSRVLDVGGGSGAYAMAFVRAREGLQATVFDRPEVIPLTRGYVESEGLSERIWTVTGDYDVDSLGEGFDLVFLSSVVNGNSAEGNRRLIRKCAGALNQGGRVAVLDLIMEEDRTRPEAGALFAVYALVRAEGGDTYTEAEVREWMVGAGLSQITKTDTGVRVDLMTGTKVK
jgi:3-hydroxy-5-methyl-1-naphthoate 3-O-methyltransferase